MNSREIIFICGHLHGGGAERVACTLANSLVDRGWKFTFYLLKDDCIKFNLDSRVNVDLSYCDPSMNCFRRIFICRKILKSNPDAVLLEFLPSNCMYTALAKIGLPNYSVASIRNYPDLDFGTSFISKILTGARNWSYKRFDSIVCQTPDQIEVLPSSLHNKCVCIENPLRNKFDIVDSENNKSIVCVGRLEDQKNYELAIGAFEIFSKSNSEFTLDIFGVGPLEKTLMDFAAEKHIKNKVVFHGFCNVEEALSTAYIYLMTSNYEGIPNSMMEAVASGLPVVTTDFTGGGAQVLVKNDFNGVIVDSYNAEDVADGLAIVMNNYGFYKRNAIVYGEDFTVSHSATFITKRWEEILNCGNVK